VLEFLLRRQHKHNKKYDHPYFTLKRSVLRSYTGAKFRDRVMLIAFGWARKQGANVVVNYVVDPGAAEAVAEKIAPLAVRQSLRRRM
jgi:hypothetical protein